MPFYHKLGKIPPKRHTQFRKEDGSLYYEQLFGTIGFDGMSTNSYHEYRPTMVKEIKKLPDNYVLINDFNLSFPHPIFYKKYNERIYSIQIDHLLVSRAGIFIIETKNS